ncbi:winged helix-turn-helix domain-containing protein [Lawsonibacter sp. OA9]|uniref:AfsR/SARP family transcriptional regulator n=1 Tax=Oscillospiraceae TaxID=216572 RepID=UPI001F05B3D1|nr:MULTISPECIES: BTAD domain-containing putative transcriptional regulator [Oscillospiraceae]MCH1978288.1 winged helix-turn-helix domain-containing protein [Lawsonibacter sp. OA9]MCH1981838.1 winged helix-turn-helix domain-containing protein [Ruminococcus sp. OA3]
MEERREQDIFYMNMLGGFSMRYGMQDISFARSGNSKFIQLLQLLMIHPRRQIAKTEIIETLYGDERIENTNLTLNNTIFRLRKQLVKAGLPQNQYIEVRRGTCIWNMEVSACVDVREFEILAERAQTEADEEERARLYLEACEMYKGEFLGAGDDSPKWIKQEAEHLRELYFKSLRECLQYFKRCQDYEQMLHLSRRAADLYPYEEWQLWVIDSLLAANRYKEAMRVYQEVTRMYFTDLKKPPSEQMLQRFHTMSSQVQFAQGAMEDVRQAVQETNRIRGPYYCTFPGFIDNYRFLARGYERLGIEGYMILCTLTDYQGWPLEKEDTLEGMCSLFMEAVCSSLRRGDLYTRYSANQFLILLPAAGKDNCVDIINRLNTAYKKAGSGRNKVNYYMASLKEMECRGGETLDDSKTGGNEDEDTGGRNDNEAQ